MRFDHLSLSSSYEGNVSDKICIENQNTRFMFIIIIIIIMFLKG